MAGILDEFDDATPMRNKYCSTLTLEEYEEQSANSTEEALAELIAHLENNPQQYKNVLKARKRDEAEEAGVLSYIKVIIVYQMNIHSIHCTSYDCEKMCL